MATEQMPAPGQAMYTKVVDPDGQEHKNMWPVLLDVAQKRLPETAILSAALRGDVTDLERLFLEAASFCGVSKTTVGKWRMIVALKH